jgi:hypothetical protein
MLLIITICNWSPQSLHNTQSACFLTPFAATCWWLLLLLLATTICNCQLHLLLHGGCWWLLLVFTTIPHWLLVVVVV